MNHSTDYILALLFFYTKVSYILDIPKLFVACSLSHSPRNPFCLLVYKSYFVTMIGFRVGALRQMFRYIDCKSVVQHVKHYMVHHRLSILNLVLCFHFERSWFSAIDSSF